MLISFDFLLNSSFSIKSFDASGYIFSSSLISRFEIDIFSSGLQELEEANSNLGLALNEDEIEYLYKNYKETILIVENGNFKTAYILENSSN